MENVNRLTTKEYVKRDGRRLMEIAEAVMLGDENAQALWDHRCADAECCHGCPSILHAGGLT